MSMYILLNTKYLLAKSNNSDNNGQTPVVAKYEKTFCNTMTGEINSITDLQSKKYKRNKLIESFFKIYYEVYKNKGITILSIVVHQEEYSKVSKFLNTIKKKFKRTNIDTLGYIWVRDFGDIGDGLSNSKCNFRKHFHVLIATTLIDKKKFHELFYKKKHRHYNVEFLKTRNGLKNYLLNKDLYGAKKERTYGKSKLFKSVPKSTKININKFITMQVNTY